MGSKQGWFWTDDYAVARVATPLTKNGPDQSGPVHDVQLRQAGVTVLHAKVGELTADVQLRVSARNALDAAVDDDAGHDE
jgi:hypothetical protein